MTDRSLKTRSLQEIYDSLPPGYWLCADQWGPWRLKASTLVLTYRGYEVDLERCRTGAQALDWIMQVAQKTWAQEDPEVVPGLVHALRGLLDPQATLCSMGRNKKMAMSELMTRVDKAVRVLPEDRLV